MVLAILIDVELESMPCVVCMELPDVFVSECDSQDRLLLSQGLNTNVFQCRAKIFAFLPS